MAYMQKKHIYHLSGKNNNKLSSAAAISALTFTPSAKAFLAYPF
jgi:hypothetical protein